jgi:hypothetical protein
MVLNQLSHRVFSASRLVLAVPDEYKRLSAGKIPAAIMSPLINRSVIKKSL